MATYRMLQPGLAQVTREDGQSIVLPLDEHTAQLQGLTPEQAAVPRPFDPDSAIGPNAVAGEGAAAWQERVRKAQEEDASSFKQALGSAKAAITTPVRPFEHPTGAPFVDPYAPQGASSASAPAPAAQPEPPKAPPRLIPVAGGEPAHEAPPSGPNPYLLAAQQMRQGTAPAKLAVTSETKKYHELGPVDPALQVDIARRQGEVDQGASNVLEDQAVHKLDYLEQQQAQLQEQAQQMQAAQARRTAIDNETQRLNMKSQADQDALRLAKPRSVDDFWKDKGMAAQVGAAIAMSLGEWGATISGRENAGMKLVNQAIERWTNDQIQTYNVAKDKATLSNNAYKDAIEIYGSPELAQTNLQLQANAAKMALIQNQAEQVGTPDALAQAQQALQEAQLQQKKLQAQAQQQAGADVEARFTMTDGGSGRNTLQVARNAVELKHLDDELGGRTLDERKFGLEEKKAGLAKGKASQVIGDAADSLDLLRSHSASIGGRTGEGGGETAAIKNDAEAKYTAALIASGVPGRAALGQAKELFEGVGDKVRITDSQDAKLKKAAALLRGNATRAIARGATGEPEGEAVSPGAEGDLE